MKKLFKNIFKKNSLKKNRRKRIAFSIYPKQTPFGGANEFIKQVASFLAANSCEIVYELDPLVTHIVIMDVRKIETTTFTIEDMQKFKKKHPHVQVIHRINNCDQKYTEQQRKTKGHVVDESILKISRKLFDF